MKESAELQNPSYDPESLTRHLAINLGDRVRDLRERRGLSQGDLGRCPGLSYGTVRDIEEKVERERKLDTLVALALALDLGSLDELFAPAITPTSAIFEKHRQSAATNSRQGAA